MKAAASLNRGDELAGGSAAPTERLVIDFPAGIPGFENCRRFVVIASAELAPLACLRALDPPEPSFLTIDPRIVDHQYDLTLREFERVRLGAGEEPLLWLALVTVTPESAATVNLRAPIVINPSRMVGCQFIRDDHNYLVNHPLGKA